MEFQNSCGKRSDSQQRLPLKSYIYGDLNDEERHRIETER